MSKFSSGWYLIYTKPRHEKKVHVQLSELKLNSFLPTKKTLRNWHDRRRYVDEPLFPSYIFVYLNDMQNYYNSLGTEGALYYVKTGKEIARVADTVVDNLKVASTQAEAKNLEVSEDLFYQGRKLTITKGALTGLSCELVQFNNRQKLLVRIAILNRNVLLNVPEEYLLFE